LTLQHVYSIIDIHSLQSKQSVALSDYYNKLPLEDKLFRIENSINENH
tara:strand:- start:307 stop:450 length:144 start_codon:yes stop_codon:yes gene_type:complete